MDTENPAVLLLCESETSAQTDRRVLRDAGFPPARIMFSGIEAARLLAGQGGDDFHPQIVVCAQKLADMDGEQFCAIVRQHPLLLGFPILLILPNDSEAEQLKTLGCGASALLGRPYSVDAIKKTLTSLRKAAPSRAMLSAAANAVDTSAFDSALATYGVLLRPDRDPEDYFRVGMACLEDRRWNLAINAFEHALRHAQVKAEAELGMAAAFKGKGDMPHCRAWLSRAAHTFVAARRWHHARAAYGRLLRHDPEARNPFIVEAHRLIREKAYDDAAQVLAQGLEVMPPGDAGDRFARLCFAAEDPEAMFKALEEGFSRQKTPGSDFLGNEIRQSLDTLAKQRREREKVQAAERKWRLSQTMARQTEETRPVQPEKIQLAREKVVDFGEEEDFEDFSSIPPNSSSKAYDYDDEENSEDSDPGPVLASLTFQDATSGLFERKPRLNELLSVMKLTWKLARRSKKDS